MTIIAFLIDTSASMNQRTIAGGRPTLLDMAKIAVEAFIKMRSKRPDSSGDRYMLLTFEDPPSNIKVGWKEGMMALVHELKNLRAMGMTMMGAALKNTFDLINLNRMQSGVDTFGQGRNPTYLEPAVVVVLTDGEKLSDVNSVRDELLYPTQSTIPGAELCRDIYRWDQRVFALVLRLAGVPSADSKEPTLVPSDKSPIDTLCEATGGRSYCVTSHRMMMQCIESVVAKIQLGVVIHFEKSGPELPSNAITEPGATNGTTLPGMRPQSPPLNPLAIPGSMPPNNWQSCRKMIYVVKDPKKGSAWWPIPENFWPDVNANALPPRTAQPHVKFSCVPSDLVNSDPVPYDRYELEPSPLTLYILSKKMPHACFQVFVSNSYKNNSETSHPFGYLKANNALDRVNLFILPYNYPVIVPLIQEAFRMARASLKPPKEWKMNFDNYLRNIPAYYVLPLKRALTTLKMPGLIPDHTDMSGLSYTVCNNLKKVKTSAKVELDKINETVSKQQAISQAAANGMGGKMFAGATQADTIRVMSRPFVTRDLVTHPALKDMFQDLHRQVVDFKNVMIPARQRRDISLQKFRNAFDIPRRDLLGQVARMRANFLQCSHVKTKLQEDDQLHSLSVSQMGNFQEALYKNPPLREVIEPTLQRQHMFGNPFKVNKKMMMIDEADIDFASGVNSVGVAGGGMGSSSSLASPRPGMKRPGSLPLADNGLGNPFLRPAKRKRGPIPKDFVYRPNSPHLALGTAFGAGNHTASSPFSPGVLIEEMSSSGEESGLDESENGMDEDVSVLYDFPPSPAPVWNPPVSPSSSPMRPPPMSPNPHQQSFGYNVLPDKPIMCSSPVPPGPGPCPSSALNSPLAKMEEVSRGTFGSLGPSLPTNGLVPPSPPTSNPTPASAEKVQILVNGYPQAPADTPSAASSLEKRMAPGDPRLAALKRKMAAQDPEKEDGGVNGNGKEEPKKLAVTVSNHLTPGAGATAASAGSSTSPTEAEIRMLLKARPRKTRWRKRKPGAFDVSMEEMNDSDFAFDVGPENEEEVRRHNLLVRKEINRLIRNPSNGGDKVILSQLFELRGCMSTRIEFVKAVSREAKSFNKTPLVTKLTKFSEILAKMEAKLNHVQSSKASNPSLNQNLSNGHAENSAAASPAKLKKDKRRR